MKRKRSLADEIFPRRGFGIYDFDKVRLLNTYIYKKDIVSDVEKWKTFSDHKKKFYIDKGYYNMYLELSNDLSANFVDEQLEDMDTREITSRAHLVFTKKPVVDFYPHETKYNKIGRQVASQILKNSHLRFGLPNRDHLVGAIAAQHFYRGEYEDEFPPESEEWTVEDNEIAYPLPPLNNTADYGGE